MTLTGGELAALGIIIPLIAAVAGLIGGRTSSRQWRETAEAREERIQDLEADCTRYQAKLEEKDVTIKKLIEEQSAASAALERVGGAKVYELLVTQAAAQADRWEEGMKIVERLTEAQGVHEKRAEERFEKTVKALDALTRRIENGSHGKGA